MGHVQEVDLRPEGLVRRDRVGAVAHLVLNRPGKLNAASFEMQRSFNQALREASGDDGVEAVVVSGNGRALSAGGDRDVLADVLTGANPGLDAALAEETRDLLWLLLEDVRQPVVVAVHGFAIGWGAGLAALADFVVMEQDAYLQDPHGPLGLAASPGCEVAWAGCIPPAVLKEMLVFGRKVTAAEALRWGLINWAVPPGTAVEAALGVGARLAALPPAGVSAVKRGVNRPAVATLAESWPRRPPTSTQGTGATQGTAAPSPDGGEAGPGRPGA